MVTGSFAEKACEEAARVGSVNVAANTKDTNHDRIPDPSEIKLSPNPAYVHITSNNTIYGTQWPVLPTFGHCRWWPICPATSCRAASTPRNSP